MSRCRGVERLGGDPQVFYRAMDFLLDCDEEIQREVFHGVANLLNLDVDVIFFDRTSTIFEIEDEDEPDPEGEWEGLRRFGDSKDRRPDLPQVVVGMAVTRERDPDPLLDVPGHASDQLLIRQVKDDLREWRLHRMIWVLHTGFSSRAEPAPPAARRRGTSSSARSSEPATPTPPRSPAPGAIARSLRTSRSSR
jgi:hypothetical protein